MTQLPSTGGTPGASCVCSIQLVPRHVAAALNPLISELHPHNTMEEVAELIEELGIASLVAEDDAGFGKRLQHQLSGAMASALRYEASQELKAFPPS